MKYLVIVNDDELRGNGEDLTITEVKYEIHELLRSGYYQVERVEPYDGISQDTDAVQA